MVRVGRYTSLHGPGWCTGFSRLYPHIRWFTAFSRLYPHIGDYISAASFAISSAVSTRR